MEKVSADCANNFGTAPLFQALPTKCTAGSTKLATVLNQSDLHSCIQETIQEELPTLQVASERTGFGTIKSKLHAGPSPVHLSRNVLTRPLIPILGRLSPICSTTILPTSSIITRIPLPDSASFPTSPPAVPPPPRLLPPPPPRLLPPPPPPLPPCLPPLPLTTSPLPPPLTPNRAN